MTHKNSSAKSSGLANSSNSSELLNGYQPITEGYQPLRRGYQTSPHNGNNGVESMPPLPVGGSSAMPSTPLKK